ncbi:MULTISPECIES: DinB family protein [unclassified Mesorhizobium]|uniref:DinB family protein n=1 Tax=unclassified Mesorhizobium TaxID=325217 RepID=UPI000F7626B0|nr:MULTISPECIES: DinB family protein [unclassified Mesorhizobium]AZO06800.1 damage-inducible protein DinB [Mesorhizobium sp. M2A.F.Ca.ET.043.02.1.1]RUW42094.1 damage-inducible protein DinB [Mesorhizobium sp. M2A.F.Ca.ET.015.02.1.1]RUW68361.1 damage-inducible protein DinB [Mesorhizobium sp. M2A.F.Ca.ET.067.02.1.1]RVC93926.1 damage-inducible protein DinB [Mesorhizobium sp. M2A.F.Ca.ET.017.03.2.1]RVD01090.1 damage-inducible protein DinB [Mesorhizobium sp. M2A.F.Ca.ET.029.05.1.1]
MTLLEHLRRMARNNLWSNDRLYRAVLALQPGEFEAERVSFFPSIKETLNHILAVDLLYFDFLTDGGLGAAAYDNFVPFDGAAGLAEAQAVFDHRLIAFCDGLSEVDLDRRVITDRREDGKIPERIGDVLAHVFLHDIHHRGQVHAMLSGTSLAPPQLDEFLLDYDIKLRRDEVERLGLES